MLLVSQFIWCYFMYLSRLIERHVRELGGPIVIGDSLFTVGEGKAGSAAGLPSPFGGFTDKIVKLLVFLLYPAIEPGFPLHMVIES